MPNLALREAVGSPLAAEPHFKGNGELMAEPGSSFQGLKPPLNSLGSADFGQLSQESLNHHHQSLFFAFLLVPAAQGVILGRQGGSPSWGCRHNPQTPCSSLGSTLSPNPTNLRGMEHSTLLKALASLFFFLFAILLILFQLPHAITQVLGLSSMSTIG